MDPTAIFEDFCQGWGHGTSRITDVLVGKKNIIPLGWNLLCGLHKIWVSHNLYFIRLEGPQHIKALDAKIHLECAGLSNR